MPERCVAGYCSNTRDNGVTLHRFPKDPAVSSLWTQQVRRTRAGPKGTLWHPSSSSVLCSAHFQDECYDSTPALKEQLGFNVRLKRVLLPTSVPSIFPRGTNSRGATGDIDHSRRSHALEKRQRLEVLQECRSLYGAEEERDDLPADVDPSTDVNSTKDQGCDSSIQVCLRPPTRTVAMQFRGCRRTTGVQATTAMVDVGTQTEDANPDLQEDEMSDSADMSTTDDSDYKPSSDDSEEDPVTEPDTPPVPPPESPPAGRVFLVFWECLVTLFSAWCSCGLCPSRSLSWQCKEVGTLLQVTIRCEDCGNQGQWNTQPFFGRTAAGNVLLSAAILFSGATVTKVLRVLSRLGVAVISERSFFRHQDQVLFKAVKRLWSEQQLGMLCLLQAEGEPIVCGGDGRADTPGHCAKYGTYSTMELRKMAVIDVQLVQSNEVGGSYHMEKVGLQRSLEKVQGFVDVGTLVTDRHIGINMMMREDHPDITHQFDIWHVAKSIKKKLLSLGQTRGCQDVKPWVGSIVNHLYWSVVSTPPGNAQLVVDKWTSVISHIHNRHSGFEGLFSSCAHGVLEGREQRKPWLKYHTKVSIEVEKIICNKRLCADVQRLSPSHQTSYLEAFHSLITHFAPKMCHFSYKGMESRVILAALHFNENANREQRSRKDGEKMFSLRFPKYKKGGYIVRKVLTEPSFGYAEELMQMVEAMCRGEDYSGDDLDIPDPSPVPEPLSASFEKPEKRAAVKAHATRFRITNST
ncbi:uncharacterized protein LOC134446823 [Engraulis encrasicolus]|uniref:uncharacterized protein LOC134446823 n=1 Tax=Engraulis encrasicolus TaxID=184585 RepID=UPI002FD20C7D